MYKSKFSEGGLESPSIQIPEGFEVDLAGRDEWVFSKVLPNQMVAGLSSKYHEKKLVAGAVNTAVLYPRIEDFQLSLRGMQPNIREEREFSTQEELDKILADWEKENPMREGYKPYTPLFQ